MKESSGTDTLRNKDLDNGFISIHVHKSGGTTFGHILEDMYGKDFFWDKSEDTVMLHGRAKHYNMAHVSKHKVIHGHINVDKYESLNLPHITWLRHPIPRTESEYSIIRQKRITKRSSPFHRRIIKEELSFSEYVKVMRNVYKRYFGEMDVDDFAFIGILEMYEESLFVFSQMIGKTIPPYYKRNQRRIGRQWFKWGTPEEKDYCAKMNLEDIDFYNRAKKRLQNEFESCWENYDRGMFEPQRKR